jgi:hypothetical protein
MPIAKTTKTTKAGRSQLAGFIAKFAPPVARAARAALARMRARLPGTVELVYDNYNALAIAFSANERPSGIVFSIALYPRWVSLFFARGVGLRDPNKLLQGSGSRIRHIVLTEPEVLDGPAVVDLMKQALARANPPVDPALPSRIVIKSVSPKQRPRRP